MTSLQIVEQRLQSPLPGAAAHAEMAPAPPLPYGADDCRDAAVLVLLSPAGFRFPARVRDLLVTLIRRPGQVDHARQLAFPGGFHKDGESSEQAALREADEEISLDPARVRILGHLTPVRTATSCACVHPVVGLTRYFPDLSPNSEVDSILSVPLRTLMRSNARGIKVVPHAQLGRRRIPYYRIGTEELWGASAKIMAELLAVVHGEAFAGPL